LTVFAKNINYGLETRINEIQVYLNSELSKFWSGDFNIYGLMHPLVKTVDNKKIIVPEVYVGNGVQNKEYSEIVINDKVAATIGFIIQERTPIPYMAANIDIVFTLQMPLIYPASTTRDTEKALLEAKKIIERWGGIYEIQDIKEGIENVFSGFDTERIKHRDMHPWYVFSLNINIEYSDNSCQ